MFKKIDKEMEAFKAFYKSFDNQQVYNDWYTIGFYESYYEMMSCEFLENERVEEEIAWLSEKEKPLAFLYNEWMDSDGAFSQNWDDMLDFLRTVYEEDIEMCKASYMPDDMKESLKNLINERITVLEK